MIMEFTQLPFESPGKIFRSAMPYSSYDPDGNLIATYQVNEVSMVTMLAGEQEARRITGRHLIEEYFHQGFEVLNLPIVDFGVPDLDELREVVSEVLSYTYSDGNVAVHCHAGIGRTGMFLACLAKIGMGYAAEESIQWVRSYIPGAVEMKAQEDLVRMV